MASQPKGEVQYRIQNSDEFGLYAFSGIMDVLTAIPGVNVVLSPVVPIVLGTAYWSNGVSPFERKVAMKLVQAGLLKFIPIVSMFPAASRSTFMVIQLSRYEDRHKWMKDALKLYAGTRAILKTKSGEAALKRLSESKAGESITELGKKFAGSRLGQAIGNDSRFQAALAAEQKFGEDFTLKDVRPGVRGLLRPSGLTRQQRRAAEEEEEGVPLPLQGENARLGDYARLAGAAKDTLSGLRDDITGRRRDERETRPEPGDDRLSDEYRDALMGQRDGSELRDVLRERERGDQGRELLDRHGRPIDVDGILRGGQSPENPEIPYDEELRRLREYSQNAMLAAKGTEEQEAERRKKLERLREPQDDDRIGGGVDGVRPLPQLVPDLDRSLGDGPRPAGDGLLHEQHKLPPDFEDVLKKRMDEEEHKRTIDQMRAIEHQLATQAEQKAEAEKQKTLDYIKYFKGVREQLEKRDDIMRNRPARPPRDIDDDHGWELVDDSKAPMN